MVGSLYSLLDDGEMAMNWYLIHTKPRQERNALLNLEQQGYSCYLPMLYREKIQHKTLSIIEEPLFPRYLFIQLDTSLSARSWGPIRSTKGVSRLVSFGTEPAKIAPCLIDLIRTQQSKTQQNPESFFKLGEQVVVSDGPFRGVEAIYQTTDGEGRVVILMELLSKPVQIKLMPSNLRKIS